jgi:hypothetical protein
MKLYVAILFGLTVLFFGGCASGIDVADQSEHGPAPYSPDFSGVLPQDTGSNPLHNPGGY